MLDMMAAHLCVHVGGLWGGWEDRAVPVSVPDCLVHAVGKDVESEQQFVYGALQLLKHTGLERLMVFYWR